MTRSVARLALVTFAAWGAAPDLAADLLDSGTQARHLSHGTPLLLADNHEGAHAGHAADDTISRTGEGSGVIRSVDVEGRTLTIDHGPIDEVDMGAMMMGFGVTGTVDLSGLAEGDTVAFRIKRGRDHSYRVTAICNTGTDGSDCLDATAAGN